MRDHRDRAAFTQLFDHFAPRLKGFIMRSGTGSGQAEEIVQDAFESLFLHWNRLRDPDAAVAAIGSLATAFDKALAHFRNPVRDFAC